MDISVSLMWNTEFTS